MRVRVIACALVLSCAAGSQSLASSRIVEFRVPDAISSQAFGINSRGHVTGIYSKNGAPGGGFIRTKPDQYVLLQAQSGMSPWPQHVNSADQTTGFVLSSSATEGLIGHADGSWTAFSVSDAATSGLGTNPTAIDRNGDIIGYYGAASHGQAATGFVREANGDLITFDAPGAGTATNQGTFPRGFGRKGKIYGYIVGNTYHGFVRKPRSGHIEIIDLPEAGTGFGQGTLIYCVSKNDIIGGIYLDLNNLQHAFLRTPNSETTTIDIAGGTSPVVTGVNSLGQATGYYQDSNTRAFHSFLRDSDGSVAVLDAPDAGTEDSGGTFAEDINDRGEIAGYYNDFNLLSQSFLRKE